MFTYFFDIASILLSVTTIPTKDYNIMNKSLSRINNFWGKMATETRWQVGAFMTGQ